MRNNPEYELQKQIADYLRLKHVLFCASAGGMRTSIPTAIKMKNSGYQKGFPDLFIYEPRGEFYGLALEVKRPDGKGVVSTEQKEWVEYLNSRNYRAYVIDNFYKAVEIIDTYLLLK
jgi:VRR-NUC domain